MATRDDDHPLLIDLSTAESWRLVEGMTVGRLVWHGHEGLTAVPLNFAVDQIDGERVVHLRTTAYSAMTRECDNTLVAFEVDDIHPESHTGWSVLIRARARLAETHSPSEPAVDSWPAGTHPVHLILVPHLVTGRRLGQVV